MTCFTASITTPGRRCWPTEIYWNRPRGIFRGCSGNAGTAIIKEAASMFEEFYEMYEPEEQEVVVSD